MNSPYSTAAPVSARPFPTGPDRFPLRARVSEAAKRTAEQGRRGLFAPGLNPAATPRPARALRRGYPLNPAPGAAADLPNAAPATGTARR